MRTLLACCVVVSSIFISNAKAEYAANAAQPASTQAYRQELEKQPVFLFCPHKEQSGSWSLYVIVDKSDPSRALAVGLEELEGKNSKELTYLGVLAAQKDPHTPRHMIAQLNSHDFAGDRIEVKENHLLTIKIEEAQDCLKLMIDARVSMDGHFIVGGQEQNRRNVVLNFNTQTQHWQTQALALQNTQGQNVVGNSPKTLTGIAFSVGSTMVKRICAVDENGGAFILMDR